MYAYTYVGYIYAHVYYLPYVYFIYIFYIYFSIYILFIYILFSTELDWALINHVHKIVSKQSEANEKSLLDIAKFGMDVGEQVNARRQTMEALSGLVRRLSLMVTAQEQVQNLYGHLNALVTKIMTDGANATTAPVAAGIEKVCL